MRLLRYGLSAALLLALSFDASGQEGSWLTVRMLPSVNPETLHYIAQITEPQRRPMYKGETIRDVIEWNYGEYNDKTLNLFKAFNPQIDFEVAPDNMEVIVPAGPRWYFKVEKTIPANSTVLKQASFEMGVAGPRTIDDIEKLNPSLKGRLNEPGVTRAFFPYITRAASYKLKPHFAGQAKAILARLGADPAIIVKEITPVSKARLIPHWNTAQLSTIDEPCAELPLEADWFMKATSLDIVSPDALRGINEVVIAVADSGIVENDPRFNLWNNLREVNGEPGIDNDNNLCVKDDHGCNLLDIEAFPADDLREPGLENHGTHVAGILSGNAIPVPALRAEFTRRLRLMILKVAYSSGDVSPDAVSSAIIYALEKRAAIINMSLTLLKSLSIRKNVSEAKDRMLFVVAAGNGRDDGEGRRGIDLDQEKLYPAALSGELTNVISVGAHDGQGGLACFSNYGLNTVDLLAPGVEIESTIEGNANAKLSGTSQAAPFVALAAALLVSEGITDPTTIRNRILSAVDHMPELREKVFSSGKLNIAKTIGINYDWIRLRDGTLLRGRVVDPTAFQLPGERTTRALANINKIVFSYSTTPGKTARVSIVDPKTGRLQHVFCDLPEMDIKVLVEGVGEKSIKTSEIVDIVPRLIH